jgi:sec-independent protein translocase protein TatA
MGELSPWHWIIVLLIFAVLFGSRRLPDAARGLGRSLRIFRAEMRTTQDGLTDTVPAATAPAPAPEPVRDAVPPQPASTPPEAPKPTAER